MIINISCHFASKPSGHCTAALLRTSIEPTFVADFQLYRISPRAIIELAAPISNSLSPAGRQSDAAGRGGGGGIIWRPITRSVPRGRVGRLSVRPAADIMPPRSGPRSGGLGATMPEGR